MSPRYIYRLIEAFLKRFKAIIFVGFLFGIILFLFLVFLLPGMTASKQRIGIIGRYTVDNLPDDISSKISGGLTKTDDNGNVIPNIAKSWETIDGGKTWVFRIDPEIFWQDGQKVKASDINYEFSDANIEVVDDQTTKFNLDSQFSAFPVILTKPLFKKGLLGIGEWKVKDISLTGGYVQSLTLLNDKKDRLVYRFYPSEDRLILGFKLGEIDVIGSLQNADSLKNWKTVSVNEQIEYYSFVGIFLNTENEKLSEKAVRQALNYATNKDNIGERAIGPISPFSWAFNPQVKQYNHDLEKVKEVKDMSIKLLVLPNLVEVAEAISKDWQEAGMKVETEVVTTVPENYEAFLATVDIPKDPDQYSLWHSTQTVTNISKFKNARIDKLLEDGRTELDQEIRKRTYIDFQRFLVEDVPAIFLYHPKYYTVIRK